MLRTKHEEIYGKRYSDLNNLELEHFNINPADGEEIKNFLLIIVKEIESINEDYQNLKVENKQLKDQIDKLKSTDDDND